VDDAREGSKRQRAVAMTTEDNDSSGVDDAEKDAAAGTQERRTPVDGGMGDGRRAER